MGTNSVKIEHLQIRVACLALQLVDPIQQGLRLGIRPGGFGAGGQGQQLLYLSLLRWPAHGNGLQHIVDLILAVHLAPLVRVEQR